ncbi:MAG: RusA family crossover junction endodeoxyribonuclease [Ferruginibacter sp.]
MPKKTDEENSEKKWTFRQNPNIDFLLMTFDEGPVPTKQDQWKSVEMIEELEDGKQQIVNKFYVKNPGGPAIREFKQLIAERANATINGAMILKPNTVEVIISISITENRFKSVDVDNLAKTVLDSLNGIAWEDDSQVVTLLSTKHVHPMKINGLFVGITKLTENRKGAIGNIGLFKEVK